MGEATKNEEEVEVCQTCGGSGVVAQMERVWPNEPHLANIGEAPCPDCRSREEDVDEN